MRLTLETEQETDGRWLAEVPELAGVLAYGPTRAAAMAKAEALAFRGACGTVGARQGRADAGKPLHCGGMTRSAAAKARRVLDGLKRIGWRVKRRTGSHRTLEQEGWPDLVFAFHESDEIGPRMSERIAKRVRA
jgi:predicted RNA binding protein YcfA (HicA-like mRNA interferase family)